MSHKNPLVSIVTPTYNRADLLGETMQSILSQDYPNIEYIVIDDGSKDHTKNVVKELEKKNKEKTIVYIRQKNMGETNAVNKGLHLSHGEIICVVNSDDLLLPHAIKTMVNYFNIHPKVLAAYPNWKIQNDNNQKIEYVFPEDFNFLKMLSEHYCMPGPGTFFRKETLRITGGRSTKFKYVADFAFWLLIGLHGQIAHVNKILAVFRLHKGSQGIRAKGNEMAAEHEKLVDWVYSQKNLPKDAVSLKGKAFSSAFYQAAIESTVFSSSMIFFLKSFFANPSMFFKKIRYELTKMKHFLIKSMTIEEKY